MLIAHNSELFLNICLCFHEYWNTFYVCKAVRRLGEPHSILFHRRKQKHHPPVGTADWEIIAWSGKIWRISFRIAQNGGKKGDIENIGRILIKLRTTNRTGIEKKTIMFPRFSNGNSKFSSYFRPNNVRRKFAFDLYR